jgi:hypothetical protein
MVSILILDEHSKAPGKRRPLAAGAVPVNARQLGGPFGVTGDMRAIIIVLILIVIILLAGVATGYIDVNQIRGAKAPQVSATSNGVVAKGGQAPAFDIETGSVQVGTHNATIKVPELKVVPPGNQAATANSVNAM